MFQKIICLGLMLVAFSSTAIASPKEIRMVVQFAPGGNSDTIARVIESHIDKNLYSIKFDYKPGNGGVVGHNYMLTLKNPGETVVMVASPSLVSLPIMNPETNPYEPSRDFVTVAPMGISPSMLVVNSATNIKTWNDFIKYTKQNPVSYGSAGVGSGSHIVSALIANRDPNWVHIPYKGPATADLLGGRLTFIVDSIALVEPHIKADKLTPVAISHPSRLSNYKHVPTLRELGVNDFDYYRWFVLVATKESDPEVLQYLKRLVASPAVQRDLTRLDLAPIPAFNSASFLREEKKKFESIERVLNLRTAK